MAMYTFALPSIVIMEVEADSEAEALAAATLARDLLQAHDSPFHMDLMAGISDEVNVSGPVLDFKDADEPVTAEQIIERGGSR